ncbi:MAG TPA: DegT/DnrJ/EryC1/StrS family aminotransferase [Candidatus Krumholzibacteria bacterium]|jgi:UDP-2-acetamido-2-deoxy-ribo-hexuluronate aminotransferase
MVPFVDVPATMRVHGPALEAALAQVIRSGAFINGPKVQELELALAERVGVKYAVACGSGTAAEQLLLMALEIGPGDEVAVPDFTFIATAEAVAAVGATPVCVDVDPLTFTIDPDSLRAAIGPKMRAVVPVSIFGQPAQFEVIEAICREYDLLLLEDACQSLGASRHGRASGAFGVAGFTSFYPSKPLGGIGDGGMVFTDDELLAERVRSRREHGHEGRHRHRVLGLNSRLDALQAVALLVKLRTFDEEVEMRNAAARRYDEALSDVLAIPHIAEGNHSSYAQYTVRAESAQARSSLSDHLLTRGIPTAVHYPQPVHTQASMQSYIERWVDTPVTGEICSTVVSLPLSAYISKTDQDRVIAAVRSWSAVGRAALSSS